MKRHIVKLIMLGLLVLAVVVLINKLTNHRSDAAINTETYIKAETKSETVTEELVLGKLTSQSELVSFEQPIHEKAIHKDDNWLGERHTEIVVSGTYKMGMDISEVKLKHVDSVNGFIYIELPEPKLISLEIPYDKVYIHKEKGALRKKMSESEQKELYKIVEDDIRKQIKKDKEIKKQANTFNELALRNFLLEIGGVKEVIFKDGAE